DRVSPTATQPPRPALGYADVTVERDVECTLPDGVVLRADVYRPVAEGSLPVLLMRLPYNKTHGGANWGYAHPAWYASRGYVVVIQDVRGRFASDGDFYPFRDEGRDGYDASDDYWRRTAIDEDFSRISVPALHTGGWYDTFHAGTVNNFVGIREAHAGGEVAAAQKLLIGPWQHSPWRSIATEPRRDVGANGVERSRPARRRLGRAARSLDGTRHRLHGAALRGRPRRPLDESQGGNRARPVPQVGGRPVAARA